MSRGHPYLEGRTHNSLLSQLGNPQGTESHLSATNFGVYSLGKFDAARPTVNTPALPPSDPTSLTVNGAAPLGSGQLLNIATRMRVQTGDNALIGGFIITGTQPKTVIVRGIGPSLPLLGALADPMIEVHGSSGELLATNDNWNDATTRQQIIDSGLAPTNNLESALWGIINPGAYTVVLRGTNNTTGVGLFEVYDLDQTVDSKLANVSTRGFVDTGDNVMIGGIIVGPTGSTNSNILVRAIGPSLSNFGIPNPLADPMLELHNGDGGLIASNDNWRDSQPEDIQSTGIPPNNDQESAILSTLSPGLYTAIVRGKNNSTGVGLVEAYSLDFRIDSISNPAPIPFEPLHISGTGFNPAAAIKVHFFDANGFAVDVPVDSVTSTSLTVIVPPYFSPTTQLLASGVVSLKIQQTIGTVTNTSNTFPGVTIAALPALTMPDGTVTANWAGFLELYLSRVETNLADAETFSGGQVNTAALRASVQELRTHFGQLKTLIRASISDPSQTPVIGFLSGVPITLTQTTLRQSDQLVTAMFRRLRTELQTADAPTIQFPTSGDLIATSLFSTVAAGNGPATTPQCYLSYIEVIDALIGTPSSETVVNAKYTTYIQQCADHYRDVVAPQFSTLGIMFAAMALIPPATLEAAPIAATLGWGAVAVQGMAARLDSVAAALRARDPVALQRAKTAWRGTWLGAGCGFVSKGLEVFTPSVGGAGSVVFDIFTQSTGICDLKMPTYEAQVGAFISLSQTYSLTITTSGLGAGSVLANPPGPTYTPGTVVTLTAVPNSGSTFAGWSGSASGTGQAVVLMDANKSVIARFDLSTDPWDGTWTGTVTGTFSGGGCSYNGVSDLTFMFTVSSNVLTGSGSESGLPCFDLSNCSVSNFPNTTGTVSGNVAGASIDLSYSGTAIGGLCDGQSVGLSFTGTRNGTTITGTTPGGNNVILTRH